MSHLQLQPHERTRQPRERKLDITWGIRSISRILVLQTREEGAKPSYSTICPGSLKVKPSPCKRQIAGALPRSGLHTVFFYRLGNLTFNQGRRIRLPYTVNHQNITRAAGLTARHLPFKQFDPGAEPGQPIYAHVVYWMGTALLKRLKQIRFLPCAIYASLAQSTEQEATNFRCRTLESCTRFHESLTQLDRVLPLKQRDPGAVPGRFIIWSSNSFSRVPPLHGGSGGSKAYLDHHDPLAMWSIAAVC